jgi:hypothetical protein
MIQYLVDFVLGLAIGGVAGLLGVGGGFLIVPTLTLMGLPVHQAIGTSLACITISSLSSAYTHLKKGAVLFRVVIVKESFSVPSAVLGAYLAAMLPEGILRGIFAFLLMYLAYTMVRSRECSARTGTTGVRYRRVPLVGVISGLTSGLLGISGGVLNVPLFHTFIELPMRYAVGTSSLALFFTAFAATWTHYHLGQVRVETALLLAPGLIIGAHIGAKAAHSVSPTKLKLAFALLLILVALKMLV